MEMENWKLYHIWDFTYIQLFHLLKHVNGWEWNILPFLPLLWYRKTELSQCWEKIVDLFHIPLEVRFLDGLNCIKTSNKASQNELRNILNKRGLIWGKNLRGARSCKFEEIHFKRKRPKKYMMEFHTFFMR